MTTSAVADRAAIAAVQRRYAHALDARDWTLLASCFLPDARVRFGDFRAYEDRAGLLSGVRDSLERFVGTEHAVVPGEAIVDGDRATASCAVVASHVRAAESGAGEPATFVIGGDYADTLARVAGTWFIAERELVVAWEQGDRAAMR